MIYSKIKTTNWLIILFALITLISIVFKNKLTKVGINYTVLLVANGLLFAIAIITTYMHTQAAKNPNPHVFSRSIMAATAIKLFSLGTALLLYILHTEKNKSIGAIITSMVLYVLYTYIEVRIAVRLNKTKNGGN